MTKEEKEIALVYELTASILDKVILPDTTESVYNFIRQAVKDRLAELSQEPQKTECRYCGEESRSSPCYDCKEAAEDQRDICTECGGSGETLEGKQCDHCGGYGIITDTGSDDCETCGGSGKFNNDQCYRCCGTGLSIPF